jgi:hypothetical protein
MIVNDIYLPAKEILGKCDRDVVFQRLTEAITLLANKGNWDPLVGFVDICGSSDLRTFALPNDVETPLAVNICGKPAYMRNKWHEFHLNGAGSNRETPWSWDDAGLVPTISDIIQPSILVAVADLQNDLSTRIRVFGKDSQGRVLRTQEPDGTWKDGYEVPANILSDFPSGLIQPNPYRYFYRIFSAKDATDFVSASAHGFQTGVSVELTLTTGPLPEPLVSGNSYFIGVVDEFTVRLYLLRADALAGTNPIVVDNFTSASQINLMDRRQVATRTKFTSVTALNFIDNGPVSFTGAPTPEPILSSQTFYIHLLDEFNFTIHATPEDAAAGVNPLFVKTPGTTVVARASQNVTPYTKLTFSVDHNFLQGDAVTVANASGDLPTPLLPGVTYYVRYLAAREITLHTSIADAAIGTNAIIMTSTGTGTSSVVKLITATASVGSVNNISAPNHNLNLGGGDFVQFQSSGTLPSPLLPNTVYKAEPPNSADSFTVATTSVDTKQTATRRRSNNVALITTLVNHGLITGDVVDIEGLGGAGYNANQVEVTVVASDAFTYSNIGSDEGVVGTLSRRRAGNIAVIVTSVAHGLTTGDFVNIQLLGGSNYNVPYVQVTVIDATTFYYTNIGLNEGGVATTNRSRLANVSQITTASAHGLSNGDKVSIQGLADGSFDDLNATVTVVDPTNFTYPNTGADVASTPDTGGYVAAPQGDTAGKIASEVADAAGQVIRNRVNISTVGTGQLFLVISRAFAIGFYDNWFTDATNLATGSPFKVDSTGVFPATDPTLSPLTTYYARRLDDFTIQFFTSLALANDSTIRMTATRERTANVATLETTANHGFTTGDFVDVNRMDDVSYNAQRVQITVTDATHFTYPNTGPNEANTADTNGQVTYSPIKIEALGSGPTNLILERSVTATLLSNSLEVDSAEYLAENTVYQFETDGTLPAPLAVLTNYKIRVVNGLLQVYSMADALIVLTNIGDGDHFITRDFDFLVDIPTSVQVLKNEYSTGDSVIANTTGTLPTPLVAGSAYYVRRIDDDSVEIYDTYLHSIDTGSTLGRIIVFSKGTGVHTFFQQLPAIEPQWIERIFITPEARNGFVDLYAWDYGRSKSLTMLGHYAPNESQPQYRRIKTLNSCAWIRMRYRRKTYKVSTLDDYIPLNSQSAILMMLRSMELYRTNFFDEGSKYEGLALKFLNEEHESRQGPEVIGVQFNNDVYQNTDAQWPEM